MNRSLLKLSRLNSSLLKFITVARAPRIVAVRDWFSFFFFGITKPTVGIRVDWIGQFGIRLVWIDQNLTEIDKKNSVRFSVSMA